MEGCKGGCMFNCKLMVREGVQSPFPKVCCITLVQAWHGGVCGSSKSSQYSATDRQWVRNERKT